MSSVAEKLQRKSQRPASVKQVRLKLVYVDFWSAVKLSFFISLCIGIVFVVAIALIYMVLSSTHIFDSVNSLVQQVNSDTSFSITKAFPLTSVLLFAVIIGVLDVVIGTVLGAIACLLYNLTVRITGGVLVGFTNQ